MTNWGNPEEHFTWALRHLPTASGIPTIIPPEFLRVWSQHLWDCGFAHHDYLAGLADADGNIHISRLPKQRIKWQPPVRGPRHGLNNAARWVPVNEPDPTPMRLPDIRELTANENAAMLEQYRAAGMIPDTPAGPVGAQEERV